jgi:hypothetical protein
VTYSSAGGETIHDEGERRLFVKPVGGHGRVRCLRVRVGNVKTSLLAVSGLTATGHEVKFIENYGEAKNVKTGEKVLFPQRRKVFEAEFEVAPYARVPNGLGAAEPCA